MPGSFVMDVADFLCKDPYDVLKWRGLTKSDSFVGRAHETSHKDCLMRKLAAMLPLAFLAFLPAHRIHAQSFPGFSVDFTNCTEFAGEGPVSLTKAEPLVPKGFTIAQVAGNANIVIRATSCASVAVDGHFPQQTNLSQIGINIVAPDGTGDINNYTLVYLSNNPALVASFNLAGLPAEYDPRLTYQFTAPVTANGDLYVAVDGQSTPPYFIYGPETAPPPNSATVFLANWWYSPKSIFGSGRMRQQTLFPAISFGTSAVTFYTSSTSLLGNLIGGNTFSNLSVLALRGVYPNAHMEVTVTR